jgi:uncharacterized protein
MYIAILLGLITAGIALAAFGRTRRKTGAVIAGACMIGGTIAFFGLLSFWGEMLWFEEVGLARRFWTEVLAKVGTTLLGAAIAAGLAWVLTLPVHRHASSRLSARKIGIGVAAVTGALWGVANWSVALRWVLGVSTPVRDPVLGKNTGFYLFTLPFYDALYWLAFAVSVIATIVAAWHVGRRALERQALVRLRSVLPETAPEMEPLADHDPIELDQPLKSRTSPYRALFVALGALALVLGVGRLLAPYHLMYSRLGVVHGPGWTDVHVRLPAYYAIAVAFAIAGLVLLVPAATRALERRLSQRFGASPEKLATSVVAVPAGAVALLWGLGLGALPALFQWLLVQPNELTLEEPYLRNNIAFTRDGFDLGRVEIKEFPVDGVLTPAIAAQSERQLSEIRIWDPRALDEVLDQFQQLRLYYEVTRVDPDRYTLDGRYRQVMIAPREMESSNLPADSQTFVNRHFKYTHGHGLVMAPVNDFTSAGLPRLVVRDVPPIADYASLRIDRPEIYYGERTNDYVVANSRAPEFDYPAGGANVYAHYEGRGGISLHNFWRRLVYGWKVGDTQLLFSDYPKPDSRIMFRRNVAERVATVAPFLELDHDPYTVLVDGRVKWIIDAYTSSSYYPYSEPYSAGGATSETRVKRSAAEADRESQPAEPHGRLDRANYVRNSVKAVVDAYDGTVSLYVFTPEDPIVQVWSRIYPDLFRPMSEMPAGLRAHVRYPEALLHTQGIVFSKYHMTDPRVFYNQEDLWVRATEKYYEELRPVDPYYVMWQPPGSEEVEFILMQPFTPKNRQVLIGWIAGMCDGDNYGNLVAYRFPKDKWVLGPQQVDTKIDQSPELSAQLTLWDQHGKRVIRGNVLAIPIAKTILYVEPIYIRAQTAAYPELRMVVLMHGDDMSYAPTFAEALEGLINGKPAAPSRPEGEALTPAEAAQQANRAFDEYLKFTNIGQFAEAGKQLELLREALRKLENEGRDVPTR